MEFPVYYLFPVVGKTCKQALKKCHMVQHSQKWEATPVNCCNRYLLWSVWTISLTDSLNTKFISPPDDDIQMGELIRYMLPFLEQTAREQTQGQPRKEWKE